MEQKSGMGATADGIIATEDHENIITMAALMHEAHDIPPF